MAKNNKRKKAQLAAQKNAPAQATISRRGFLQYARTGALAIGALGFTGYFGMRAVQAGLYERDLSRLTAGKPTVVQVHDPSCPTCNALQKEVRRALSCFGECEIQYLIADIKTAEGAEFAAGYGVPHVTLLLFDRDGQHVQTVRGPQTSEDLKDIFAAHQRA